MDQPFDRFDEIVLGDTEFIHRTGELYEPVCLAYKELRSGRADVLCSDELGPEPPHAHGKDVLFVGFTAAEPEFYQSVFGSFDMAFLDLRVEGIHQTNIAYRRGDTRRQKPPRALISFLRANGIRDGDEAHKVEMHRRILEGPPYPGDVRALIKSYNFSDVLLLEKWMEVCLARIPNFEQALMRGEYVKLTAEMFRIGMPADTWAAPLLRQFEARKAVRLRAVSDTDLTHGLYTGPTLTQAMVKEFAIRHKIKGWRPTATGKLGASFKDFERLEARRPEEFKGLADAHKTIQQLHELNLFAGPDGRYRDPLWAFSTITSRAAPSNSPFTLPAWFRYTLTPTEGSVLAYIDLGSAEFGVAAGLSRCAMMIADYNREPYLLLPILTGLLPSGATKLTHGKIRDDWKPMILAIQYGGKEGLLAYRLKLPRGDARRVVDLHHERYEDYWEWSDRRLQRAYDDGELVARDGWRCKVVSSTPEFTARNWLIQTNLQALFRYGSLMTHRRGVRQITPVHDAIFIELSEDKIERDVAIVVDSLERASRRFLYGLTLKVDVKLIRYGERFTDSRGEPTWAFVERSLHEYEEGQRHAAG